MQPANQAVWEAYQMVLEAEQELKVENHHLEDKMAMIRQALDQAMEAIGIPYPN